MIELFESDGEVLSLGLPTYAAEGLDSADSSIIFTPLESCRSHNAGIAVGLSNHFFSHHALAQQLKV